MNCQKNLDYVSIGFSMKNALGMPEWHPQRGQRKYNFKVFSFLRSKNRPEKTKFKPLRVAQPFRLLHIISAQ